MYFDNLRAALLMDGHGAFVWGAYSLTLLVLVLLALTPWRRQQRLLRQIRGELRRDQGAPLSTTSSPASSPTASEELGNASGA